MLPAHAVAQPPSSSPAAADDPYRIFLLTIGPGREVYSLFGHNALLILDTSTGSEIAYNWGVFDFNQPNFIGRFILGRMLYRLEAFDARLMLAQYLEEQRGVALREIRLSPEQKRRLVRFCQDNDTPERRDYRYDYYLDNCSTRLRDALDHATDGQLSRALKPLPAQPHVTFRWHTDRLTRPLPWLHLSLHYVLGSPVDRPLNRWEEMFLPRYLEEHARDLTIAWEDGTTRPLLGPSTTLVPFDRFPEPQTPPDWRLNVLAVSLTLSATLVLLAWLPLAATRLPALLGVGAWSLLCTLAGGLSAFGWFLTDHVVSQFNENILQLSPLSLALAVAVVVRLARGRCRWLPVAAALPLASAAAALPFQPLLVQPNATILLLALPLHAASLAVSLRLARPPRDRSIPAGLENASRLVAAPQTADRPA